MKYIMALFFSAGFLFNAFAQTGDSLQISEEELVCFQTSPDEVQCFVVPQQNPEDQMENEGDTYQFGEEEGIQEDRSQGDVEGYPEERPQNEMEIFKREPYFEEEEEYDEDWT